MESEEDMKQSVRGSYCPIPPLVKHDLLVTGLRCDCTNENTIDLLRDY